MMFIEKTENKQKVAGVGPFFKEGSFFIVPPSLFLSNFFPLHNSFINFVSRYLYLFSFQIG